MRVLVACEFSGIVRDAFRRRGHDAWSCDLLPTERPGKHIVGDVRDLLAIEADGLRAGLDNRWDLMIAHPPCTRLCVSGNRWRKGRETETEEALDFVRLLLDAPIPRIALENPVGIISTRIRKPEQIVHPYQFGHPETKTTCLWLKNLPPLQPTDLTFALEHRIHRAAPGPDRWKERSRTFPGIAKAMAQQWGTVAHQEAA